MALPPRFSSELELKPGLREDDPDGPEMPPEPSRIARELERFKRWIALDRWVGTLVLLAGWLLLAGIAIHVLGAVMMPILPSIHHVQVLTVALSLVVPILISPALSRMLPTWGIVINTLIITFVFFFPRLVMERLDEHGTWTRTWAASSERTKALVPVIEAVERLALWGIHKVPMEELENLFGTLESPPAMPPAWDQPGKLSIVREVPEAEAIADGARRASGGIEIPPTDPLDPYWARQAADPDRRTVVEYEIRLLELVNQARVRHGFTALALRSDLCRVANAYSVAMRDQKFFDHRDPTGRGPRERAEAATIAFTDIEEVLAEVNQAQDVPRELFNDMQKSIGNRMLIFSDRHEYDGVGAGVACDGPKCIATLLLMRQ